MEGGEKFILNHLVCPHCWTEFHPGQLVWIAQHEDLRGDIIIPDGFIRFRPSVFNAEGDAIDARGLPCNRIACPHCHLEIPRQLLEFPMIIFSVIGTTFSGKSYFLATSTWQLRRELAVKFGMAFNDADAAANSTLTEFQKTLFSSTQSHVSIEKTQTDAGTHYVSARLNDQWVSMPKPFMYALTPTSSHHANGDARRHSYCICYYDNAGEHFRPGEDTTLTPVTMHMAKAKVLLFIFDPTQDTSMRNFIDGRSGDPQLGNGFPTDLQTPYLTEAVERIRRHAHLQSSQRLDTPLIVLVSKADTWAPLIDIDIDTEPYIAPEEQGQPWRVDLRRIEETSDKIRTMLFKHAGELVSAAESSSKEVLYLPVSALGCSPHVTTAEQATARPALVVEPSQIHPRWATVPLVYPMTRWANVEIFKSAREAER